MKKAVIIALVFLVFLQAGILSLRSVLNTIAHKTALMEKLKSGRLDHQLEFVSSETLQSAKWENDQEFYIGDKKFDLVKPCTQNGQKGFLCINDNREEQLIEALAKSEKKSSEKDDLFKKLNIQITGLPGFDFTHIGHRALSENTYRNSLYSLLLTHNLIKPPALA